ncbi:MAG: hypothetical protein H7210_12980 [Pyrinomonadaceae bacterium]|nr:hypothetical protein [Phycisphaerales bacterium]
MKADHLSYRKATGVSLLGLAIQLILGLVVLVYSAIGRDPAAFSAALFILGGCVVWLSLAVVFDQHRRERLEALEAESIERSGVAGSSVFDTSSDELRVAAKRLAWMHRVMLPAISLGLAGIFILLGWWRMRHALRDLNILTIDTVPSNRGVQISLGIVLAVIGFVFARYVSGMAKQKAWANLRAGAAQIVGAAVIGFGMVLAQFVDFAGSDSVIRYIHILFPGLMIVIGAEFILNFVLSIYRPRKAGDISRPAFDSRILGFIAAPDKIAESIGEALNYQFGFNVTGSWFYQLLSRSFIMLVVIGGLVVWMMTFFSAVRPNERGLRLRNGQLVGEPLEPGIHFKLPWPIETIHRFDTSSPHRLDLAGYPALEKNKSYLWTVKHHASDKNFIVQPAGGAINAQGDEAGATGSATSGASGAGGAAITVGTGTDDATGSSNIKDIMLLSVEIPVIFTITNLKKYNELAQEGMGDRLLEAVGRRIVMQYLATQRLEDVLSTRRSEISEELRARVTAAYKQLDAGVDVIFVGIVGVHPPTKTAIDFEKVVGADQRKLSAIEVAKTDEVKTLTTAVGTVELAQRIVVEITALEELSKKGEEAGNMDAIRAQSVKVEELLTKAGGEAGVAIERAKAQRWVMHMAASSRAARYQGQLAAYGAGKNVYLAQLYFDTLKDVLGKARVYITPDQSVPLEIRTDLAEIDSGGNAFKKLTEDAP